MRTAFVALTALTMTALLGPTVVIARLLRVPQGPRSIYARCVRLWARTIKRSAGMEVRVFGAERVSGAGVGGAVLISNHVSWFDVFALASELSWSSFVAKAELRRIPLFGFAAECVGIVFLDRENRKQAFESYKIAAREVQLGRDIIVFPEGTRGTDYHLRPFKKGPFVLAIASESPIIPTIVHGARELMPKGSFRIRKGVVEVRFLEPVSTKGFVYERRGELMTIVWHRMADALHDTYGVKSADHPIA